MDKIKGFKAEQIPFSQIAIVATSGPDYEMVRVMLIENYPEGGDYTILTGGHCSCYDFHEVEWDAITYNREEVRKLAKSWVKTGYTSEKIIAPLILAYIEELDEK